MKRLAWLVIVLGACGGGKGDYAAARAAYCGQLAEMPGRVKLMFTEVDRLDKLTDAEPVPSSCTGASGAIHEARGLLAGLDAGEMAFSKGAADTTADRAPFVTAFKAGETASLASSLQIELEVACRTGDRAGIRGWVTRAKATRAALLDRFAQQVKDCAAIGAK